MEWIAARQALAMIAVVAVVETGELSLAGMERRGGIIVKVSEKKIMP
jgi:hypothetical protein